MFRNLVLAVFSAASLWAQESVNSASVAGRITDPAGNAVEGARVLARQTETNLASAADTDRDGRFRFAYLRVGAYTITIHRDGFSDAARNLTLTVGAAFDVSVQLTIGQLSQQMLVTEDATVLEGARTQVAGTVARAEVESLPLNGRNFLDLALLVPGVSPTNTGSNQLFAETSAVPGQGISTGSQRNFSNNFIVDGLSANDDAAGLSGIFFGLDVVNEFQVVTSGGHAEFGRALGGYINMVTRTGTNALHGSLYGYFRNQRFNAANPLSNTRLPLTQAQYGASLGGPVVRDRAFYFTNFERRDLNQSGLITIAPANAAAINAKLDGTGYAGMRLFTGLYPNPVHSTNLLAKTDHQIGGKDLLSLRYSLYDVQSGNSRGAGALSAVSAAAGLANTDHTLALGNVFTISARTVNETRAQWTHSRLLAAPNDPVGPAVSIAGVASFGTLSSSPTGRGDDLYELVDNISHQAGRHALRAGADFLYNDLSIGFPRSAHGSYAFSSLSAFLAGAYNNAGFTQTFGPSAVALRNPNVGFYAQDEWKAGNRLVFNFGLRYDLQFLRSIATDTNNFSPRAGFAWTPFASGRTVIRGGYGLFYDRVPLRALANALLSSGNSTVLTDWSQASISLSPAQTGAPVFPFTLPAASLPPGVLVNFTTMNPHIGNAYSEQGSLEIERQLGSRATVSAAYEHLRGLHLIASVNQNVPACAASGGNNGCRPDPAFGNNSQYSSLADSHYDGLHLSLVQRPTHWGSYRVSYTWSKALDNVGEFFFSSPIDNFNIWRDYGRSDDDQRHRLVFDGTAQARGFALSGIVQYYSAFPLNITSGVTTVQGTPGRPLSGGGFIGRNTGEGNDFFGVNARLSRSFRIGERLHLESLAEAFNLLNHRNNLTKNGVFGAGAYPGSPSAAFGQITAVQDSRSLQLALRLRF